MRLLAGLLVGMLALGLLWLGRGGSEARPGAVGGAVLVDQSDAAVRALAMDLPLLNGAEGPEGGERVLIVEAGAQVEPVAAFVLRGHVVQAGEGAVPIAGADVGFDFGDSGQGIVHAYATSGADGAFQLELEEVPDVPELVRDKATFRVWARADGYWPSPRLLYQVSLAEVLEGDEDVRIALKPGASLTGRVVDASGVALRDAFVRLKMNADGSRARYFSWSDSGCAEDGTFQLAVRDSELLSLSVSAPGYVSEVVDLKAWDSVAHPDVGDVVLRRGLSIGGRLVCAHGEPLEGVHLSADSVELDPRHGHLSCAATTDANGQFFFEGFEMGAVHIQARGDILVTCQAGDFGLELVTDSTFLLAEVVDEEGHGLPGASLSAYFGMLADGEFTQNSDEYYRAQGPRGRVVLEFQGETWNHAMLDAETSGGQEARVAIDFAVGECMQRVRLVVPKSATGR